EYTWSRSNCALCGFRALKPAPAAAASPSSGPGAPDRERHSVPRSIQSSPTRVLQRGPGTRGGAITSSYFLILLTFPQRSWDLWMGRRVGTVRFFLVQNSIQRRTLCGVFAGA